MGFRFLLLVVLVSVGFCTRADAYSIVCPDEPRPWEATAVETLRHALGQCVADGQLTVAGAGDVIFHVGDTAFAKEKGLPVIPFGTAVQEWRRRLPVKYTENSFGGDVVGGRHQKPADRFKRNADGKWVKNCDVFHLNERGEYFQALVWARTLFGVDLTGLGYKPDFVSDSDAKLMKEIAMGSK